VPSSGLDAGKSNWPLGREYAIPGSGTLNAPSIAVHKRTDSGNAPFLRVIQGPATQLDWPTGLAFDAERYVDGHGTSVLSRPEIDDLIAKMRLAEKAVREGSTISDPDEDTEDFVQAFRAGRASAS